MTEQVIASRKAPGYAGVAEKIVEAQQAINRCYQEGEKTILEPMNPEEAEEQLSLFLEESRLSGSCYVLGKGSIFCQPVSAGERVVGDRFSDGRVRFSQGGMGPESSSTREFTVFPRQGGPEGVVAYLHAADKAETFRLTGVIGTDKTLSVIAVRPAKQLPSGKQIPAKENSMLVFLE